MRQSMKTLIPSQMLADGTAKGEALICVGRVDELTIGEVPVPDPASGEVLIRVKATAADYANSIMVAGRHQTKLPLPFSTGWKPSA
jgi:NADPH:quinone reductase-like Zn-dependent oxidoreductase